MKTEIVACPYCKNKGSIKLDSSKEKIVKCSICNNIFTISPSGSIKYENIAESKNNQNIENYVSFQTPLIKILFFNIYDYNLISIIIGILLIVLGAYIFLNFLNQILNLGIALIILGISFLFLTAEIKKPQKSLIKKVLIAERITIIFAIWIFISLLIINILDFRLFIVTIIIGFLIIKEITRTYVTEELDKKMKIFIIAFFVAYLMIIGDIIITFLSE